MLCFRLVSKGLNRMKGFENRKIKQWILDENERKYKWITTVWRQLKLITKTYRQRWFIVASRRGVRLIILCYIKDNVFKQFC